MYYSSKPWDELPTIIGKDLAAIQKKASREGLKRDKRVTHGTYNDTFFDVLTPESTYVLGLWFADGYMYKDGSKYRVSLTLKGSDKYLIDRIAMLWGSNVYHKTYGGFARATTQVNSQVMYSRLLELNGSPRKSLTLKFPDIPNSLVRHFIRGYFDGDGCISIRRQYRVDGTYSLWGRVSIVGTKDILESIYMYLKDAINADGVIAPIKHTRIHELRLYTGCYKELYEYLYDNSDIYLIRKKNIFEEWLKDRIL